MKNDAALKAAAQAAVQSLMSRLHGVRGCVVSTEDGFEVAARAQGQGSTRGCRPWPARWRRWA